MNRDPVLATIEGLKRQIGDLRSHSCCSLESDVRHLLLCCDNLAEQVEELMDEYEPEKVVVVTDESGRKRLEYRS